MSHGLCHVYRTAGQISRLSLFGRAIYRANVRAANATHLRRPATYPLPPLAERRGARVSKRVEISDRLARPGARPARSRSDAKAPSKSPRNRPRGKFSARKISAGSRKLSLSLVPFKSETRGFGRTPRRGRRSDLTKNKQFLACLFADSLKTTPGDWPGAQKYMQFALTTIVTISCRLLLDPNRSAFYDDPSS